VSHRDCNSVHFEKHFGHKTISIDSRRRQSTQWLSTVLRATHCVLAVVAAVVVFVVRIVWPD
jgi:hypothetical protein